VTNLNEVIDEILGDFEALRGTALVNNFVDKMNPFSHQ
jgi:hypothetical protein